MERKGFGCFQHCGVTSIFHEDLTDASKVVYWDFFSPDPWHEVRITKALSANKDLVLLQLISFS